MLNLFQHLAVVTVHRTETPIQVGKHRHASMQVAAQVISATFPVLRLIAMYPVPVNAS